MLAVRDLEEENKYIFFATRNGTVKKTELKDFSHVMSRGIIAISIEQGDELVAVRITDGKQIVFLASHDGRPFASTKTTSAPWDATPTGVRGMDLDDKDYIVGMATTAKPESRPPPKPKPRKDRRGRVRRTAQRSDPVRKVRSSSRSPKTDTASAPPPTNTVCTNRGGKGVINVKTTERNGKVVGIAQVTENSEVMLISQYGKIIRMDSKQSANPDVVAGRPPAASRAGRPRTPPPS